MAFGTYDARAHPRVGVLIDGLRAHGVQVREVNRPLGLDTAARVDLLRRPWRLPLFGLRLARCWTRLAVAGLRTARTWRPDAVLVGYLGHFDVLLARRLFRRIPVVLDHLIFAADTAADRGESGSVKQSLLRRLDRAAIGAADVVVLDTPDHARLLAQLLPAEAGKALVVPVGAPAEWLAAGARRPPDPTPDGDLSVIFYGLFTPLQGAIVIGQALALLAADPAAPRITVSMVGHGQDRDAARAAAAENPAVTWLDWVDPGELPALAARHDVCLGIFGTGPKAQRVVPNKVFQGAAAGCAIVTSDTEPQRAVLRDAACYVPPGDAAALAAALRDLASDPARLAELRRRSTELAHASFTASAVAAPLHRRLVDLTGAGSSTLPAAPDRERLTDVSTPALPPLPPLAPRAWLRYDVVGRILDRLRPATVLEMGCGQGGFGARLAARSDYVGIEPDELAATVATARIAPLGGTVLRGDQHVVPAGSTYDLVCAFEVLEHLEHDAEMLTVWAGFVRPGGHLLISVPAWPQRFGPMDTHAGHYRRYTPAGLDALLVAAGLEPVGTQVYGWPLGYALEAVRNPIDARKLAREAQLATEAGRELSKAELTAATGRTFQPRSALVGTAVAVATTPFRYLQRLTTSRGTGLVALARRPPD